MRILIVVFLQLFVLFIFVFVMYSKGLITNSFNHYMSLPMFCIFRHLPINYNPFSITLRIHPSVSPSTFQWPFKLTSDSQDVDPGAWQGLNRVPTPQDIPWAPRRKIQIHYPTLHPHFYPHLRRCSGRVDDYWQTPTLVRGPWLPDPSDWYVACTSCLL